VTRKSARDFFTVMDSSGSGFLAGKESRVITTLRRRIIIMSHFGQSVGGRAER
jgi:hypothetical protein